MIQFTSPEPTYTLTNVEIRLGSVTVTGREILHDVDRLAAAVWDARYQGEIYGLTSEQLDRIRASARPRRTHADRTSLLAERFRLGADGRPLHAPRPEAREPLRALVAPLRLIGGRQSYARQRCDRKRATLRAARASQ